MRKVILYAHGGSGNHGCEALVRTTADIVHRATGEYPDVISTSPEQDKKYIMDVPIHFIKKGTDLSKGQRILAKIWKSLTGSFKLYDQVEMKTIARDTKNSLCISIGGDNYCYSDYDYYGRMNKYLKKNGNKTILWGCSIEPELLKKDEVLEDLRRYDCITVRESLTYEAMKKVGLKNIQYCPDTAFLLPTKEIELPSIFEKKVVGINVSPLVMDYEKNSGMVMKNYVNLVEYIMNETDMNIALIPHVIWDFNDDLIPLENLYNKFKHTGRVVLVDEDKKMNCCQLKYVISKCSYVVTARTHASIAAYSTGVPTLVVGYSVKAKGIAQDIFGEYENYVCAVQQLEKENDLEIRFKGICKEADSRVEAMRVFEEKAKEIIESKIAIIEEE